MGIAWKKLEVNEGITKNYTILTNSKRISNGSGSLNLTQNFIVPKSGRIFVSLTLANDISETCLGEFTLTKNGEEIELVELFNNSYFDDFYAILDCEEGDVIDATIKYGYNGSYIGATIKIIYGE